MSLYVEFYEYVEVYDFVWIVMVCSGVGCYWAFLYNISRCILQAGLDKIP